MYTCGQKGCRSYFKYLSTYVLTEIRSAGRIDAGARGASAQIPGRYSGYFFGMSVQSYFKRNDCGVRQEI